MRWFKVKPKLGLNLSKKMMETWPSFHLPELKAEALWSRREAPAAINFSEYITVASFEE